jgi:hypothetical protein
MVDGVKAPAVIVVISDGEDSCGGNPCAIAQRLKAQKPLLKVNVVDIIGNSGTARCIAGATGGKVLRPQNAGDFEVAVKQAAADAQAPAHCKR